MTHVRDDSDSCSHPNCYRPPEVGSKVCSEHVGPGVKGLLISTANERDAALARVTEFERDLELAATDLPVAIPKPGTDAARMLMANAILRKRVAELEREKVSMSSSLQAIAQCSPENDLPPVPVSNSVVVQQMRDKMVYIHDELSAYFRDDYEHLGQPYGDGFDAIYSGLNLLIGRVKELEVKESLRRSRRLVVRCSKCDECIEHEMGDALDLIDAQIDVMKDGPQ